jgi:hypothetical protein
MSTACRADNPSNEVLHGTARSDTARRILEKGWTNAAVCEGRYTDDYKRDMAMDFGKGIVSEQAILDAMDRVSPTHVWVKQLESGRQRLIFYWGFQSYTAELDGRYVEFDFGEAEEELREGDA